MSIKDDYKNKIVSGQDISGDVCWQGVFVYAGWLYYGTASAWLLRAAVLNSCCALIKCRLSQMSLHGNHPHNRSCPSGKQKPL